jgi:hypothetical protein
MANSSDYLTEKTPSPTTLIAATTSTGTGGPGGVGTGSTSYTPTSPVQISITANIVSSGAVATIYLNGVVFMFLPASSTNITGTFSANAGQAFTFIYNNASVIISARSIP